MKGLISIYLLIVLMMSGLFVLSSYQEILYSLTQIKFYFNNKRVRASNQNELVEKIKVLDFNPLQETLCIKNNSEELCYLNNSLANTKNFSFPINNPTNQNLLIDFNYYQRLAGKCQNLITARTQLEWSIINPKTCLQVQPSTNREIYYNFNLAIEDLKILRNQTILVSGASIVNKLTISQNVTIISLGELIIDDLILTENANLSLISIHDSVRVRHYPEESLLISQTDQYWQIGLSEIALPMLNLKTLDSIAVSLTRN